MEQVARTHEDIVITKHGKPIAKLVSVPEQAASEAFGHLAGSVTHAVDLISPTGEAWDVDHP